MPNNDSVSRETTETPGGPGHPPARPPGPACSKCGREPASPGQSYGPDCHAAYMRMWRQPRQPTPAEDSRLATIANLLRVTAVVAAVLGGLVLLQGCPANAPPGPHCKVETSQGVQWWACRSKR